MIKTSLTQLFVLALLGTGIIAASAETPSAESRNLAPMQQAVEEVLEEHPGGTQTGWNEVSWDDGEVVLNIAPEEAGILGVSGNAITALSTSRNCASGRYCAFSRPGYSGSKLTVSSCTNRSTSQLPQVRSIANSRSSGTVRAYNGNRQITSVAPRSGKNVSGTITRLTCG